MRGYSIVRRNSKYQPFLVCPGWSFQSPLLDTIYDTSLDNYIQWVDAKIFCPIGVRRNLFESSSVWTYRTATPYRKLRHLWKRLIFAVTAYDTVSVNEGLPPVHTLPHRTPQQQISVIFVNIRAESYPGIRCGVDQAVLDSKNHGRLLLGRFDLVLKFKEHFR